MRPIFTFRWLRRIVRKNTAPVPFEIASKWSVRLSRLYVFFALNVAILIIYASQKEDLDMYGKDSKKLTTVDKYRALSKGQEVEVFQVRGYKVADQYTIPAENKEESL